MLQINKKITLDFQNKNIVSVNAKQYDKESRFIEITCIDQGSLYKLNKNNVSAFIRLKKPDSLGVFNLCEITNEGKIIVELTEQCLTVSGKAQAEIVIIEKVFTTGDKPTNIEDLTKINAPVLSTMTFVINITPSVLDNSQIESSYEFDALNNALAQIDYNNKKVENLDKTLTENENVRIQNENTRKANETTRVSAEQKRQSDTANAISKANEATNNTNAAINAANDFIFKANGAMDSINQKALEVQKNANNAKTSETNAKESETASSTSANNSANSALESKSYAVGTNNSFRSNDSIDNSKYYSEKSREYSNEWKGSLLPKGTISFSQLPTSGMIAGYMYSINEAFVTDNRFQEGSNFSYPKDTNVFWTENDKWKVLSGVLTRQLTQAQYNALSDAEKKNGTIYYITDNDFELYIDSDLSSTSKNPIQNKVVTEKFTSIESNIQSVENNANLYTDNKIANLINGAPETLDTLKEVADAISASKSTEEALNKAIGTKANQSDFNSHINDSIKHITSDERNKWNKVTDKVDKVEGKILSSNDYTTIEKNKLAGIADGANKYIHPSYNTSKTIGLYKVAIDSTGHVSSIEQVTKDDIVNLGIPSQDTNVNYPIKALSEKEYNALSETEKKNGTIYLVG